MTKKKKLKKFQGIGESKQRGVLEEFTPNNIIKYFLMSTYPYLLTRIGFKPQDQGAILESAYSEAGLSSTLTYAVPEYPFPLGYELFLKDTKRTGLEEIVRAFSVQEPHLAQLVPDLVEEKYIVGARALAHFDYKITETINRDSNTGGGHPTLYIAVSSMQDLLKVVAEAHKILFGNALNLPVTTAKVAEQKEELFETHLIEGTNIHELYRYLRGDTETLNTTDIFSSYNTDAIIAITPDAIDRVPIRIHRRKSRQSAANKYAYSILSFLIYHSYQATRKNVEDQSGKWRGEKYFDHIRVGVHDFFGTAMFMRDHTGIADIFAHSGLNSLFEVRNPEYIKATGEQHYDFNYLGSAGLPDFSLLGRMEGHLWPTPPDSYIGPQLLGSRAWATWKLSRKRELESIHPVKKNSKSLGNVLTELSTAIENVFMSNLRLAHYPGGYHLSSCQNSDLQYFEKNYPGLVSIRGMERQYGAALEGRQSLHNFFPHRTS